MSLLIYNISLFFVSLLANAYALFNSKAKKFVEGRKDVFSEIKKKFNHNTDDVIWFHCSSLGEFEMSQPLIEKLKLSDSNLKILITFFSPSGYEVRKDYAGAFHVCYLPFDSKNNAIIFLDIIKPKKVFFAKYDLWFHYLNECKKREIPLYLFNANFTSNQVFFKWYGGLFRKMLHFFNQIYVLNKKSAELLKSIDVSHSQVTGDTRFDKVYQTALEARELPEIANYKGRNKLLVIGSSWKEDIDILFPYLNTLKGLKVIIAPHEIGESNLTYIESKLSVSNSRYSKIDNDSQILIIDNVGILSSIYKYADFSYIGGAFRTGLHNTLEAATFGVPIIIGPYFNKFPEAIELVKRKGIISIANADEYKNTFDKIISDESFANEKAEICKNYVMENVGSTTKIIENLN